MGYQPGLDGLRAISVIAVILYHAGFSWMPGGFFGVEVFFVVSGFLITSLLVDERLRHGGINLRQFWVRRWRRLLPALFTMIAAVTVWGVLFGSPEQQSQLRRDLPWSIFYGANWGQIAGKEPYFQPGSPPLLRHLWSLAVEEQWYVLWPLVFVGIAFVHTTNRRRGRAVVVISLVMMAVTWWLARAPQLSTERVNFLYLSTVTRSSGLLLGAGVAMLWHPWRPPRDARGSAGAASAGSRSGVDEHDRPSGADRLMLDGCGAAALTVLLAAFAAGHLVDRATYRWVLPVVTLASTAAVMVVVHPAARRTRALLGSRALVAVGQRSYGLYLWTWPVTVICGARNGSFGRFVLAMAVAVPLSELCFRYVESPIRHGALRRWFVDRRHPEWGVITLGAAIVALAIVVPSAVFLSQVRPFDAARGGSEVAFDAPVVASAATGPSPAQGSATPATVPGAAPASVPGTTVGSVTLPTAPVDQARRVVVVGDSQAHALAVNLPAGIGSTFRISDGAVDGCSVYSDGAIRSQRTSFQRSFGDCAGWDRKWANAASANRAQIALVVLGAWDVFDVEVDGRLIPFGTAAADRRFTDDLRRGIAALTSTGAQVALLEVPCMRPQSVKGAAVPPLPERADDGRVAHLNALMRQVAATDPQTTFVAGPAAWCNDPAIASDLGYRWDGVHVYKPGAKLIYETIAPALLALPVG